MVAWLRIVTGFAVLYGVKYLAFALLPIEADEPRFLVSILLGLLASLLVDWLMRLPRDG